MLAKKVPKLVKYVGNEARVLLERRHMNLAPQQILDEIEKRRASFPVLNIVDEIWIVEKIFYGTDFGGEYFRFELREGDALTASYDFDGTQLPTRYEDEFAEVVHLIGA